ncbi:MAG: hypothetical protein WDO19_23935 [Bacteroidota bacterium]
MKKSIIILMVLLLILAAGIVYFWGNGHANITPPERPANIPQQAEWVGGADGGNWYQVTKVISKNAFKIKIYNDGNGELEIDTTFILNSDCAFREIDSLTLTKRFNFFDGKEIELLWPEKGKRCSLIILNEKISSTN